MNVAKRITKLRVSALIVMCIVPLVAIILGVILLINNTIINSAFLLAFIIIPVFAILLLALTIFSNIKRFIKIILTVLILISFAVTFLGVNFIGEFKYLARYENEEIELHYTENNHVLMPSLSEIAQPTKIEYFDYSSSQMIYFTCDAKVLICKYDENMYTSQKALLDSTYTFQNQPMSAYGYACEPSTEINGYFFRALSVEKYELNYPKSLAFIATNDAENEIVYMCFYDDDMDYIESLSDFINDDCGWKYIR